MPDRSHAERSTVSDQLPEEAPAGIGADDVPGAGEGAAREAARRQARQANRSGHAPGDAREHDDGGRRGRR